MTWIPRLWGRRLIMQGASTPDSIHHNYSSLPSLPHILEDPTSRNSNTITKSTIYKACLGFIACFAFLYMVILSSLVHDRHSTRHYYMGQPSLSTQQRFQSLETVAIPLISPQQKSHAQRELLGEAGFTRAPSRVPFVNRLMLAKLGFSYEKPLAGRPSWPPLVTAIPGESHHNAIPKGISAPKLMELCAREDCKFLLPLQIGEQESKARLHLVQLLELSRQLNRVLVLPNVGNSRLGACLKRNFDFYYDTERFIRDAQPAIVVTLENFLIWVQTQRSTTAQVLSLSVQAIVPPVNLTPFELQGVSIEMMDSALDLDVPPCLYTKLSQLQTNSFFPLRIAPNSPRGSGSFIGTSIVQALSNQSFRNTSLRDEIRDMEDAQAGPRVLVVDWSLRHAVFKKNATSPVPSLRYSPRLIKLAAQIAPQNPYIAVHWRMETVPVENLHDCAHKLINTIRSHFLEQDADAITITMSVWLATDLPLPSSSSTRRKSGTFHDSGAIHREALQLVIDAFRPEGQLATMQLASIDGLVQMSPLLSKDRGVPGILDKIVSSRANHFITASEGCGRSSSFTNQIRMERSKRHLATGDVLTF